MGRKTHSQLVRIEHARSRLMDARRDSERARAALREAVVLAVSVGMPKTEAAAEAGIDRGTAAKWAAEGLEG